MQTPDFSKQNVVFVGTLKGTENSYKTIIRAYGGVAGYQITSKVTMVVKGELVSSEIFAYKKLRLATERSIPIIDESEFCKLLIIKD